MKNITIIGGRAITAENLLNILVNDKNVTVKHVTSSSDEEKRVEEFYPQLKGKLSLPFEKYDLEKFKDDTNIFFLCVGHGEGFEVAKELYDNTNALIIDLSANFRLINPKDYEDWYKFSHPYPEYLEIAAYGMPELNSEEIKKSRLIACPGCYPTSVILALVPLLKSGIEINKNVTIVATSGISGAGRKAVEDMGFPNPVENIRAYKVGVHQHTPEMEQGAKLFGGKEITMTFVPQVGSFKNGIISEIIVDVLGSFSLEDLKQKYKDFYQNDSYVDITDALPEIKNVAGTNNIEIALTFDVRTNKLIITSALDNTIKGASGQAIQNMNLHLNH
ncbi:MAG: N-acetyl-gamma-glutamyl-phosphate reductase [Nitrospinae bacterium]|nr:N-acetyl-gamma-glutamyl-phosphate reductase [Nitrospinota bacterium]